MNSGEALSTSLQVQSLTRRLISHHELLAVHVYPLSRSHRDQLWVAEHAALHVAADWLAIGEVVCIKHSARICVCISKDGMSAVGCLLQLLGCLYDFFLRGEISWNFPW